MGELGFAIIYQTILTMFSPAEMDRSFFLPLTWSDFLHRVLLPQTALLLIMEDLKLTGEEGRKEALNVLQESSDYGAEMFPDNNEGRRGLYDSSR